MESTDVINFWFKELSYEQWFKKDLELDKKIESRFGETLKAASKGDLAPWRESALGRLAEIIVLDQFSRNVYRDTPQSFAQDKMALDLAKEAVKLGMDKELTTEQKSFLYMPYMHSETLEDHEEAVKLYSLPGLENNLKFEHAHKKIIEEFGRYPHRNAILGRESTPEEIEFLGKPGSSF